MSKRQTFKSSKEVFKTKEEWREVEGYGGGYLVSNKGKVKSVKKGKILKPALQRGYERVYLYRNSERKTYMVHRLVAMAFIENTNPEKNQVNHIDGKKCNNCTDNLEWVTQKENNEHAFRLGLNTTEHAVDAQRRKVVQKTLEGKPIKTWRSLSDAGRALNIPIPNITHCCRNRINHAGGYKWSYLDC